MDDITVNKLEIALILQQESSICNVEGSHSELVKKVCCGKFSEVLQAEFSKSLFTQNTTEVAKDLEALVQANLIKHFVDVPVKSLPQRELEVLLVAVSCLQMFVQNNWLGPRPSEFTPKQLLPESIQGDKLSDFLGNQLSVDGEPVYGLAIYPEFLYLARYLLQHCQQHCTHLHTVSWWMLRCIAVHQQVLDNKSNTLRESVVQLIETVEKTEPLMTDDANRALQLEFHVEAGRMCHMFYMYREAKQHLCTTASKLSGLHVELTGAMGRRTRYQENEKAQLLLKVTRDTDLGSSTDSSDPGNSASDISNHGNTDGSHTQVIAMAPTSQMPKDLNLDDDTLLDAISFSETDGHTPAQVSDYEQAMILGLMEDYRRSHASDDNLAEEETQAYITFVLSQRRSWSVHVAALLLRSKLEKDSRRRVDRSMRQLEELFNQTMREEPMAGTRLRLFYAVNITPVWEIQRQLAELLLSLGAIGSALEIYEQLELWEDAIACYQRIGKTEKAETVIREQLQIHETPNLWCFLGDITRDIEHYEKAWLLSKHRSARAQRCMGYLYFHKANYEKSLECFQKSLNVNALQVPVWFTYGCAAMAAEDHKLAVLNFKRCVSLDYDNYEAWNNLASAYVKLKEKKKAFMTLNDALKCNYDNWRIWENYLVVATDCGEFQAMLRAYHRLLDLRDRYTDEQVLGILVRVVKEEIPDATGEPGQHIEHKLRELFGRITSKITDNTEVWRLYAQLCSKDTDKMLQYLQKSHRCVMQKSSWEKAIETCRQVSDQSILLADTYAEVSSGSSNPTQSIQMLSSAKLMLRGVLSKIKQQHTDPITQELVSQEVKDMCSQLDEKLTTISNKLDILKQSS